VDSLDIPRSSIPGQGPDLPGARQTQIIIFLNAFDDEQDLYRFTLRDAQNLSFNLAFSGDAYNVVSMDALGGIAPPANIVLPTMRTSSCSIREGP